METNGKAGEAAELNITNFSLTGSIHFEFQWCDERKSSTVPVLFTGLGVHFRHFFPVGIPLDIKEKVALKYLIVLPG
ncbi:MAG: hypothetical protein K9N46_11300 [Candidatus Marinimicrobia bacterium]|nr:hypothetical protein [Candidatus Neomarinimicrobiota bacterium]MCF7827631.1 hypothetical protein [Candidatus Neomarinimicrobiota bacterium]MCF7881314.1 hypothetical protein [Candidatus Neomarinimicrobiota bacterium]